jgi:hypothetical protein
LAKHPLWRTLEIMREPAAQDRAAWRDRPIGVQPSPGSQEIPARMLGLQQQVGNAVVARAVGARRISRQSGALAGARAGQDSGRPVQLVNFLTSGTALNGQQLGPKAVVAYYVHGVELRFSLGAAAQSYRGIRPRQYSGPEAVWIKRGDPLRGSWVSLSRGLGTGWDDPEPESITGPRDGRVAYYDSPGPNLGPMVANPQGRPSRVFTVQNFTGWVEGVPASSGSAERISPVIAWYAKLNLIDRNWHDHGQSPDYAFFVGTEAGRGWRPTDPPEL